MVVAQFLPVIGRKENQCIVIDFVFYKSHDKPADLVIKMGNAGIVSNLCFADQIGVNGACLRVENPSGLFQITIAFPGTYKRRPKLTAAVQIKIIFRSVKRRMRL